MIKVLEDKRLQNSPATIARDLSLLLSRPTTGRFVACMHYVPHSVLERRRRKGENILIFMGQKWWRIKKPIIQ